MKFKFYLIRESNKRKTITFAATDTPEAIQFVKRHYPGWQVSMFWQFSLTEGRLDGDANVDTLIPL